MKRLFLSLLLVAGLCPLRAQDTLTADTIKNEIQASVLPLLQAATGSFSDQPGLGLVFKRQVNPGLWIRVGFSNKRLGGNAGDLSDYSIMGFDDSTEIRKYRSYGQYWRNQIHLGAEYKLGNKRVRQYVGGDLIGGWFAQQYTEFNETYKRTFSNNLLTWQPVSGTVQKTLERETKFVFGGISAFYGIQFLLTDKLYLNTQFQADARMIFAGQTDTIGGVTGATQHTQVFDFSIPGLLGDIAIGCRF